MILVSDNRPATTRSGSGNRNNNSPGLGQAFVYVEVLGVGLCARPHSEALRTKAHTVGIGTVAKDESKRANQAAIASY